ncbi:type I glyceraldehyde-3-phosphate dehydrogenase [Myroides ceti]|uniref:Type I glyceraldehyde-3-phosphate dehydrogenase n=1 Tax=Paenimyroides ceti TaxID=395087 RepID=A0ABT8CQY4_9FLAO|nr:type I glyceraldehyde-3-phosphate dehydrogenase [Paenimyroides ceti]MDN3706760.1 type I glyceraldehyde-3-phosphate dehydrogenase [Paenimyroides ceti]
MKNTRIAINGFGRIGRNLCRLLLHHPTIEIVAINDLADTKTMAHLLKYDSTHGKLSDEISFDTDHLYINEKTIRYFREKDISRLDWNDLNIDFVIEATGKHKTYELLEHHIRNGAKKVILSVPPEDNKIKTVVLGVNEHILNKEDIIVSNASCTTNNAAPMIKIIDALGGLDKAFITTVHSYTSDQSLQDQPHKDLRRARAAAQSIIPTTTGAAKALTKIFPEFEGKIGGGGIRVPVPDGSLTDITCYINKDVSVEEINAAFKNAAENELKGIIEYTEDPVVSIDIVGNPHSCVFDAQLTSVLDRMVKIVGWYDNEIGYSSRIIDLITYLSDHN